MRGRVVEGLSSVDPAQWDALAGRHNPFVEHAFLHLCETSKSAGAQSGWLPLHVVVEDKAGRLVAAAPCYLKDHSYGEYIFDWQWADAAARAGLPYYPKLVVGVPFTPATGPRLLVRDDVDKEAAWGALLTGLSALERESGAAGLHVLFCLDDEAAFLEHHGLCRRATHQFHWRNDGYESFAAFLGALKSEAKKQIKRERRRVVEQDIDVELVVGAEIDDARWAALWALYQSTGRRKWGTPYLTKAFFDDAPRTVVGRERAVACFARQGGEIVAGSLSFEKGKHLYGRYWGAHRPLDAVHFELCYYRLVEHAIARGLTLVEAGAQGEHKLKRGFLPVVTHSAHRLAHPALHDAVARLVARERRHVEAAVAKGQREGPFRDDAIPGFAPRAGIPLPGEGSQR